MKAPHGTRQDDASGEHLPAEVLAVLDSISKEMLEFMGSPQCRAWLRLADLLGQAQHDPVVQLSPAAQECAERMQREAGASLEVIRVQDLRMAVEKVFKALPTSLRGRDAAGIIAKKLGVTPTAVRTHLIALGHKKSSKRK